MRDMTVCGPSLVAYAGETDGLGLLKGYNGTSGMSYVKVTVHSTRTYTTRHVWLDTGAKIFWPWPSPMSFLLMLCHSLCINVTLAYLFVSSSSLVVHLSWYVIRLLFSRLGIDISWCAATCDMGQ